MIIAEKDGRRMFAMILDEPVNGVIGIVQCGIPGCEAHLVLMADGSDPSEVSMEFMTAHDCDPSRFAHRQRRSRGFRMQGPIRG